MTGLPEPEQWVLSTMNEMEVAEMIEQHIEHYAVDKYGNQYPVHYPTPFVGHFMNRSDGALPTVVAIATAPIVLADGGLLATEGLDRLRGIQIIIQDELRDPPEARRLHGGCSEGGNEIFVRRMAGRRCHRQHWQVQHHRRRTDDDRAVAAAGPAMLLRYRRTARWRENHVTGHANHGRNRGAAGCGGVVDQ